ncbi:hypothetical protein, partial [Rhodococcus qingshengii]|uniref:hypothetical protein n=1 Tax=Rhodococcus qingshengii TaxID=334542 RepID=UPI00301A5F54
SRHGINHLVVQQFGRVSHGHLLSDQAGPSHTVIQTVPGHKLRIDVNKVEVYVDVTIIRADDPEYIPSPIRWDEAEARKAGKWGSRGPWTNYPMAMLRSRAITEAARTWASDALYGVIYTAEELGAVIDEEGAPVPQARQQQRPQIASRSAADRFAAKSEPEDAEVVSVDVDSLLAAIEAAESKDVLRELWKQTATLPAQEKDDIQALIMGRIQGMSEAESDGASLPEQLPLDAEPVDAETVEEQVAS